MVPRASHEKSKPTVCPDGNKKLLGDVCVFWVGAHTNINARPPPRVHTTSEVCTTVCGVATCKNADACTPVLEIVFEYLSRGSWP